MPDIFQHDLESPQRLSSPIDTDGTEEPMFNGVPFRSSGWIVAHHDFNMESIRQLVLKAKFPQAGTIAIAAAAIT